MRKIPSIRILTAREATNLNAHKKSLKSSQLIKRSLPKSLTSACSQCRDSIITSHLKYYKIKVVDRRGAADRVALATRAEEAFKENLCRKIPFKDKETTGLKLLRIIIVFISKRTRKYLPLACRTANFL
jgi:hypothetical protein